MENSDFKEMLIKRAKSFSLGVLRYADTLPSDRPGIPILTKQVIRSATSVGANIVEAQGSPTERDFSHFLGHALKSANETVYWFDLLGEYVHQPATEELRREATELSRMLGSIVSKIKRRQ
jgi:four helix bundle protein